ncbi:MAG: PD40 domain-containing protein [Anaerolineales bacterium]|nr:PD40 domain-containing protein [Anaerolineales bacterium]
MKRNRAVYCGLILICVLTITGCSTSQVVEVIETEPVESVLPTESEFVSPPEEPAVEGTEPEETANEPIPCMIAFDTDRDGNREIYLMGPDGSDPVNLTNNPADDFDPEWSPDGKQIAFVSNRDNGEGGGQFIYVMNPDGSDMVQMTYENESQSPDWSNYSDHIIYSHQGDIFVVNIYENEPSINLTNSPEPDINPKWSPDSSRIAWIRGEEGQRQIFVMDADGSNVQQITSSGEVYDLEWTTDGRFFTHWANDEYDCFNCIMNADGTDVSNAGGKGDVQEYIPFWTVDWQKVEMNFGEGPDGNDEIFLVSEIFPDMFFNLTNNPANDRNPASPAFCGPGEEIPEDNNQVSQLVESGHIMLGYRGDESTMSAQSIAEVELACEELEIQCVSSESITELVEQDVDIILSFSNRWDILGSFPERQNAAGQQVPILNLNAEGGAYGDLSYNLDASNDIVRITLDWMFESMGGEGKFVYFNVGDNDMHQNIIDTELEKYPGILADALPASYDEPISSDAISELVNSDPEIGAIWANEFLPNIFWGVVNLEREQYPFIQCEATQDMLQFWSDKIEFNPNVNCIAVIEPGGIGYEGVYVAYYLLTGEEINLETMGGIEGNTFLYDLPIITNENVNDWFVKMGEFQIGRRGDLMLQPMTPDEIRARWFLE